MSLIERPQCPVCGNDEVQERLRLDYDVDPMRTYLTDYYAERGGDVDWSLLDGEYVIDECTDCGLLYQRYIPDDHLAGELYERWIDPQHSLDYERTKESGGLLALQVLDLLRLVERPAEGARVLDYGMGWGRWCRIAAAFGCRAEGVELSGSRREHAEDHGLKVVELEDAPAGAYDVINAEQVFEHVPDPVGTARRLSELLRPGGVLRIAVPSSVGIHSLVSDPDWTAPKGTKGSLHALHPLEHLNCMPERALERLGVEAGLDVLRRSPLDLVRLAPLYEGKSGVRYAAASVHRSLRRQASTVWLRRP